MEDSMLKKIYEIAKNLAGGSWYLSRSEQEKLEYDRILQEDNGRVVKLTEKDFPTSFTLKFEDLPDALKELDTRGLIKFDGHSHKIITNSATGYREAIPALKIRFFKFPDSDSLFKETEKLIPPELEAKPQEKVVFKKNKKSTIALPNFPPNLKWNEVSIRFLDGQSVMIRARNLTVNTDFEGMLFMDEKRKLPNKQWELLVILSKRNGELSWQNNKGLSQRDINAVKKRKQKLSDTLKDYFQIQDDPFSDYSKGNSFEIKIGLTPENSQLNNEPKNDSELTEFIKEQSPEIDDQEDDPLEDQA